MRSLTELCGLRVSVESYVAPKGPLQCKPCQRFGHMKRNCGYATRCVACGGSCLTGGCPTPREQRQCCNCGGNRKANYRESGKMRRRPLQSRRPSTAERAPAQATLQPRKLSGPGPLPSRWAWARGAITSSEGVCRQSHHHSTPNPNPSPQPVTEAPKQPKVTSTRKTAKPKKPKPTPRATT